MTQAATLVKSQSALARALGFSRQYVSSLTKKDWFPARSADGWTLASVREALARNLDPAKVEARAERRTEALPSKPSPGLAPPSMPAPQEPSPAEQQAAADLDAILAELEADVHDASSSTVAAAHKILVLSTRQLAGDIRAGAARAASWTAATKALAELRQSERSAFELAKDRKLLVPLYEVKLMASILGQRMVRVLNNAEAMLGPQVAIWLSDKRFQQLDGEAQQREARQWFAALAHDLRVDASSDESQSEIQSEFEAEYAEFQAWRRGKTKAAS